mgnify:CR=1 FL=1
MYKKHGLYFRYLAVFGCSPHFLCVNNDINISVNIKVHIRKDECGSAA